LRFLDELNGFREHQTFLFTSGLQISARMGAARERKMRHRILVVLLFSAAALRAQGPGMDGPPPPGGPEGPMGDSADTIQRILREPSARHLLGQLTKELKLGEEQKHKIRSVLEQRQRQLDELTKSPHSSTELVAKSSAIDQDCWGAVRALLADAQEVQFDAVVKKLAEKRERDLRRVESDDGPPPPPMGGPPPEL
jgi:Spy/CpxP family protein refolding chaperone